MPPVPRRSQAVPLPGIWNGGFWMAEDLWLPDGATVNTWEPREGSFPWELDAGSVTLDITGYPGGQRGVRFDASQSSRMRCPGIVPLQAGDDLPLTIVADVCPTNVNGNIICWTLPGSATPYSRLDVNSVGNVSMVRQTGAPVAATLNRRVLVDCRARAAVAFTGTQTQVYNDYIQDALKAMDTGTLAAVTQCYLGALVRDTVTIPFDGMIRGVGITSQVLTQAEIDATYDFFYGVPRPISFLGDSVTLGAGPIGPDARLGFRYFLWIVCASSNYKVNTVGTLQDGGWAHDQHDGHAGKTISELEAIVDTLYGPGNPIPDPYLVMLMIGGANVGYMGNPPYDGPQSEADYISLLAKIRQLVPNAKLAVTTIVPAQDPGVQANIIDFNARIQSAWDAFDAAHPTNQLRRSDAFTSIGGVWSATYFADTHPNLDGYELIALAPTGLVPAVEADLIAA